MARWSPTSTSVTPLAGTLLKSGDQALVENANRRFVRYLVGDVRYEGAAARDALNELYSAARGLVNFFTATTRLTEKKRAGRSVTRRYDEPRHALPAPARIRPPRSGCRAGARDAPHGDESGCPEA